MTSYWRHWEVQIRSEKQFKIESAFDYLDYLIWIISGNFPWFQANFSSSAKKTFRPYLLSKLNQPWNGLQYIKLNAKDVYCFFSLTCVIKSCQLGPVTRIKIVWSQVQPFSPTRLITNTVGKHLNTYVTIRWRRQHWTAKSAVDHSLWTRPLPAAHLGSFLDLSIRLKTHCVLNLTFCHEILFPQNCSSMFLTLLC